MLREPDAPRQPTPQDNQLMSKHRVLGFKPNLRLEWRGQDGQNEKEQPNHSASLGDSITSSTRIRFSVHTALVLNGPDQPTSALTEPLGSLAAQLLEEMLEDGQLLGVAWGRTLAAAARALTRLPRVDVVQVAGNPTGLDFALNPVEIVHRIARAGGGKPYPIYAPMWVEDQAAVEGLRSERSVAEALALYHRIDVLVVGIGSWHPPESCLCAAFASAWDEKGLAAGVSAVLSATRRDDEGTADSNPQDQHGQGITAEQLRLIPDIGGIGGGLEKAAAIASVLRGGWISTLVTDAGVARRLLA